MNRWFSVELKEARVSNFILNETLFNYVVNTTKGFIKKFNEDWVSIVVNIKWK